MKLRNKETGEIIEGTCFSEIIGKLNKRADYSPSDAPLCSLLLVRQYWAVCSCKPYVEYERFRRAIRNWAEANDIISVLYDKNKDCIYSPCGSDDTDTSVSISFDSYEAFKGLEHRKLYLIDELCGK